MLDKEKMIMFKNKNDFIQQYKEQISREKGKEFETCGPHERYMMLAGLIAEKARDQISAVTEEKTKKEDKKIYYFSIEFLLGKLLENYLQNFGVLDIVKDGLADLGEDLKVLLEQERDAGIGNGGLGRLAACFLDSAASTNIPLYGKDVAGMTRRLEFWSNMLQKGKKKIPY